jgi:hypothetical protein
MAGDLTDLLRCSAADPIDGYDAADLERRGSRLRRRRQRTMVAGTAALVLTVSLFAAAAVRAWRSVSPSAPAAPAVSASAHTSPAVPSPAGTAPASRKFIPPTRTEAGNVVMPVTFIDGTTAEIVYPRDLDLAGRGVDPYGSGQLEVPPSESCCQRDFAFAYGEPFPLAASGAPLRVFPSADGRPVRLLRGHPVAGVDYLVFEIGAWRLGVWDGQMSDEQRALWSANLRGRVSTDGFPVLSATVPLRLTPLGESFGPSLEFGRAEENGLQFSPTRTCPDVEPQLDVLPDGQSTLVLCRTEWSMSVNAVGDRAFVQGVIDGLKVRNVRLAAG